MVESPLRPVGLESQLRGPIDGGVGERNVQQNSHLHGRILRDVQFLSQEFLGSDCTRSLAPTASVPPLRLQEQTWLGKTGARRRVSGVFWADAGAAAYLRRVAGYGWPVG